jgi:hypothetical protein
MLIKNTFLLSKQILCCGLSRSRICLSVILFVYSCESLTTQELANDGIKFEVVSVSVLSKDEALKRSPRDLNRPYIVARLRLSTSGSGIEFYAWDDFAIPSGYRVQKVADGFIWFHGKGGTQKNVSSPGLKAVHAGLGGKWMILPPHSAVEWENSDFPEFAGEKHAFTIFIKRKSNQNEHEIFSETFTVPSK